MTSGTKPALSAAQVGEPTPFADGQYGDLMLKAGTAYVADYVYASDFFDHEPNSFERNMLEDFFNGLMSEESFFGIVRKLAAPVAQEPVAYQWRFRGGRWRPCGKDFYDYTQEIIREGNSEFEVRPLYASPPATPAGVGTEEIARIIDPGCHAALISEREWCEKYGKDFEKFASGYIARWKVVIGKATAILALLSRAGDQSNSTHEEQSTQNI